MRKDENWAIDIHRICAFFRQQPDVQEQDDHFIFGRCTITLVPLTGNAMNKWLLSRTQIIFDGDANDVQTIHRRFFLRFLSAGG